MFCHTFVAYVYDINEDKHWFKNSTKWSIAITRILNFLFNKEQNSAPTIPCSFSDEKLLLLTLIDINRVYTEQAMVDSKSRSAMAK